MKTQTGGVPSEQPRNLTSSDIPSNVRSLPCSHIFTFFTASTVRSQRFRKLKIYLLVNYNAGRLVDDDFQFRS
jgi:hypothetical protein